MSSDIHIWYEYENDSFSTHMAPFDKLIAAPGMKFQSGSDEIGPRAPTRKNKKNGPPIRLIITPTLSSDDVKKILVIKSK